MHSEILPPPTWISTLPGLQKFAHTLSNKSPVAVDTESNSLHAYREQLCLIQFSIPSNDYLIDALAFADLSALADFFSNPAQEKVFHAAEYDLICLKRSFDISVSNIFDTMQAARILGYKQVGLDSMLAEKLGVAVNKKFQKADWAKRPLPADMLNYARLDTHHLLDLRDCLKSELQMRGRWDLAREEFIRLAHVNGNIKVSLPSWQRIGGTQKFSHRQLAIFQELCKWREAQAERLDRPVFKVIDNKRLVAIALAAPKSQNDLEKLDLTARQLEMFGNSLLQAVERGRKMNPATRMRTSRPKQAFVDRLNALTAWRKDTAEKVGVESDLILPKAWMHTIAEQNPETVEVLAGLMPQSPWRLQNFGPEILKALHSKGSGQVRQK